MPNLERTGMNRGVGGSNLDGVTLPPTPAFSSSSTTSSTVVSAASFPLSNRKRVKAVRRETEILNKQKQHQQMQLLIQLSSSGIHKLNQYLQQCRVQQNQIKVEIADFIRQNLAKLMKLKQELELQFVAMQAGQSAETTEVQLQQSYQQLLKQMEETQHFMQNQLPSTESSASSTTSPRQRNNLDVGPAADTVKIQASSIDDAKVHKEKSLSGAAENRAIQSQATNQQVLIQSRQLLESISVPDQSMLDSVVSTSPDAGGVAPKPALEFNLDTATDTTSLASEEPKIFAAASSTGTTSSGTSLADMSVNSTKKNKSTSIPSHQTTSTVANGFDSAGLELNDPGGDTEMEIFKPTINVLENPSFLPSNTNSPAGTSSVAPICKDHILAPHPVGVSTAVVPAGASTTTAAGQCNQTLLSLPTLNSETDTNREEALSLACCVGKEKLVELLVSKEVDIEHRDENRLTPLMLAAIAGHEKVVEILLNHGAKIEAQDEKTKDTALTLACFGGHYKVVEFLLKRGAYKENHNVKDYTPLSMAASEGHLDIIKLLLANGAEINSHTDNKQGLSPLMTAAKNGHVEALRILLEMGSDINAIFEINGYTALTFACYYGKHEVAHILLENKANVELRIKDGYTPLQLSASVGYPEVAQVLIDYGAYVNAPPTPSRDTALTLASDKGLVQLVEMLLKHGAQVDVKNNKGNSALWLAANNGHLQVVELLHKAKADIDMKNNRKVSCLMAAFRKGHTQLVEWMVKRVTQFPSDEEISRIITTTIDNDLLPKCQLCKEIIFTAKDRQAAEANKKAAYLLKELDMEKNREDLKRAAAAKKREKKKQKKQEKRQADGGSIDSNLQEQDNDNDNDNMDGKNFTMSTSSDPPPTLSNNKKVEDRKFEKSRKNYGRVTAIGEVISTEVKPSTSKKDRTKLEIKVNPTKKSTRTPHVESKVKMDDSQQLKSPMKPIKREEEWKEVVRRKPLGIQENSGSAAKATTKSPLSDQASAMPMLSIIHSPERIKKVTVCSNAIEKLLSPTSPPPSSNMNALAPTSLPIVAASVAGFSDLTSRPNWTIAEQDGLPLNNFDNLAGTSMSGCSGLSMQSANMGEATGYGGNLTAATSQNSLNMNNISEPVFFSTSLAPGTPIPSSISDKVQVGCRPYLLKSPPRSGIPTSVNPIPFQPSIPVGNCYSPPPLLQKSIPKSGMEEKDPLTLTASLDPGSPSASRTRKKKKRPHKKTHQHLSQFDRVPIPNFKMVMKLPRQTRTLASGVGRPSLIGRLRQPGLENLLMSYPPPNQLGLLDGSMKYRCALGATNTICRVCYGSIRGTSFRCVLCEDYNMCCLCVTSGKHPLHPVVRTIAPTVDRDSVNMSAFITSMKKDTLSTSLVKKFMSKIAEQDAKIKEQDAKMKEKDTEIEHLVSACSEAVALLSRPFDRTLALNKEEKVVEPVQGPL